MLHFAAFQSALPLDSNATHRISIVSRIALAVVEVMTAFVDWINISFIMEKNGLLVQLLCLMLRQSSLQLSAAECLLAVVGRRGRVEDRKPILVLYNEDAMATILSAAV